MNNVFYGIDVSKGYADIRRSGCISSSSWKDIKLNDNKEGILELKTYVKEDLKRKCQVIIGVESTGGYENNWYSHFIDFDANVKMLRINPIRIHHESKKEMRRNITDKVSSETIANHLTDNYIKLLAQPSKTQKQCNLTRLLTFHQMANKQKTQLYNILEKTLYDTMPGLLSFCKDGYPNYILDLLEKFSSKSKLMRIQPSSLAKKIKGISIKRAIKITEAIKQDSGNNEDPILAFQIQQIVKEVKQKKQTIKEIELQLLSQEEYNHPVSVLSSIKGCGDQSAVILSIEIGDVTRFESADHMCSYFGTHPKIKQSGDHMGVPRMSKNGSTKYRATIYMVAKNVVIHNPYFKEIYATLRANNKCHNSALGAIMNKLTRIIYGMLKYNKPFNPEIAKAKKTKELKTTESEICEIENKLQVLEEELKQKKSAPTSKMKIYRIQKAIKESQNSLEELKTRSSLPPDTNI